MFNTVYCYIKDVSVRQQVNTSIQILTSSVGFNTLTLEYLFQQPVQVHWCLDRYVEFVCVAARQQFHRYRVCELMMVRRLPSQRQTLDGFNQMTGNYPAVFVATEHHFKKNHCYHLLWALTKWFLCLILTRRRCLRRCCNICESETLGSLWRDVWTFSSDRTRWSAEERRHF